MSKKVLSEFKAVQALLESKDFAFKPIRSKLIESSDRVTYAVTGVFQNYVEVNQNGRRYGKKLWESNLSPESEFSKRLAERSVLGMIEHPEDGITKMVEASHVVTRVWFATAQDIAESNGKVVDGDILGEFEVLPTPHGDVLRGLIEGRVRFGVSSRGSGTTTRVEEGFQDVNEDFLLETWDVVFTPSVARAIPHLVREVKESRAIDTEIRKLVKESKTEAERVDVITIESLEHGKLRIEPHGDNLFVIPGLEIGPFDSLREAISGVNSFLESRRGGKKPDPESNPAPTPTPTPTPTSKNMSKLAEARRLKNEAIRLSSTPHKSLKVSEKSALIESAEDILERAGVLLAEDASIKPVYDNIASRMAKFTEDIDEEDAPPPPAASAGAGDPPPPAPAAPEEDEVDAESAHQLLNAADLLRSAVEGNVDADEALAAADSLEALADVIPGTDEEPFEDVPEPANFGEAKRAITRLKHRLKINENRTKALNNATNRLITEHKTLKSSRGKLGEGKRNDEYVEAARTLASKYNADMRKLGEALLKSTHPDVYSANSAKIAECRTYKQFEDLVETLMKEKKKRPIRESREASPPRPKPAGEGGLHESLSFLKGFRKA